MSIDRETETRRHLSIGNDFGKVVHRSSHTHLKVVLLWVPGFIQLPPLCIILKMQLLSDTVLHLGNKLAPFLNTVCVRDVCTWRHNGPAHSIYLSSISSPLLSHQKQQKLKWHSMRLPSRDAPRYL